MASRRPIRRTPRILLDGTVRHPGDNGLSYGGRQDGNEMSLDHTMDIFYNKRLGYKNGLTFVRLWNERTIVCVREARDSVLFTPPHFSLSKSRKMHVRAAWEDHDLSTKKQLVLDGDTVSIIVTTEWIE